MAILLDQKKILGVCRLRFSPMKADCTYLAGASAWVLEAPTSITLTAEREESKEILETKLDNTYCTNLTIPGHDKYTTVEIEFCNICTNAFVSIFGWTSYTAANGDVIGFGRPTSSTAVSFCSTAGFSKFTLEVFSPLNATSGFCASGTTQSYLMLALPILTDIAVTSPTFSTDGTVRFKMTGKVYGNVNYNNGPFNDFPGTSMAPGDNEVYVALPSNYVLPTATCAATAIPAQTGES
jgi:hypothetical protein